MGKQGGEGEVGNTEIRQHINHILPIDQAIIIPIQDLKPLPHLPHLRRRQLRQRIRIHIHPAQPRRWRQTRLRDRYRCCCARGSGW